MKKLIFLLFSFIAIGANAQTHSLEKLWQTTAEIAIPESVLPDLQNKKLYVSLIDGGAWEKDGVGGVGVLSADGKQYDSKWITGLNAPKGMGKYGNKLYVADIDEVVVIDVKQQKVERKIPIKDASGLNDITVDNKGVVYVSDSRTSKIWQIKNNTPVLFLDDVKGVNGLKAIGSDLYIGAGKDFMKADKNKHLTTVAVLPEGIDGIEPVGNGDFILSAWIGYVYYVDKKGKIQTLLDTHAEKINAADIGFDPVKKILYVPTFMAKSVVAYRLK